MLIPVINTKESTKKMMQLCDAKGLTPRAIQAALGLESVQAVYKWKHLEGMPKIDNIVLLARLLEVNINDLIVTDEVERDIDEMWWL